MMWEYGSTTAPWADWMAVLALLLAAGLLLLVATALLRSVRAPLIPGVEIPLKTPEAILRERFAGGEITAGEYQERLTALRWSSASGMEGASRRSDSHLSSPRSAAATALDQHQERFIAGEIDFEEYEALLPDLLRPEQPGAETPRGQVPDVDGERIRK